MKFIGFALSIQEYPKPTVSSFWAPAPRAMARQRSTKKAKSCVSVPSSEQREGQAENIPSNIKWPVLKWSNGFLLRKLSVAKKCSSDHFRSIFPLKWRKSRNPLHFLGLFFFLGRRRFGDWPVKQLRFSTSPAIGDNRQAAAQEEKRYSTEDDQQIINTSRIHDFCSNVWNKNNTRNHDLKTHKNTDLKHLQTNSVFLLLFHCWLPLWLLWLSSRLLILAERRVFGRSRFFSKMSVYGKGSQYLWGLSLLFIGLNMFEKQSSPSWWDKCFRMSPMISEGATPSKLFCGSLIGCSCHCTSCL